MQRWMGAAVVAAGLAVAGCGGEEGPGPGCEGTDCEGPQAPAEYRFQSRFQEGSSVAHTGQTLRHVLIADLTAHLGEMTARIDQSQGGYHPVPGDVLAELEYYFAFDGTVSGGDAFKLSTTPAPLQSSYGAIGSADLKSKLAGNDAVGQHKDWKLGLVGWPGAPSPEELVQDWFRELDRLAADRASGSLPVDPSGQPIGKVHVTSSGQDLQQLLQKFLLGAVAWSQGADDYLDDDMAGAGLLSDNTVAVEGKPYTALEHAWDEGFGYFGAAKDFGAYTDDELAAASGRDDFKSGYHDTNGDGHIDLLDEHNFGHAVNAAKRDRESVATAKTDYTEGAFRAFVAGRHLISTAGGALTAAQLEALKGHRDHALANWEKAIAATVVHYVNEVLADMEAVGTASYNFLDHAKHWSELKGFALGLQFNRRSPLSAQDFATLHEKVGVAPVLEGPANLDAYKQALLEVRTLLRTAYGFDPANTGDTGTGGW